MATRSRRLPVILEKPHQPLALKFPKRQYGKQHRAFQSGWFQHWHCLHYDESKDAAFCHICVAAIETGKMKDGGNVMTLLYTAVRVTGRTPWKHGWV